MGRLERWVARIAAWTGRHPRWTYFLLVAVFVGHLFLTNKTFYQLWDTVFAAVFAIAWLHWEFRRLR